jgi:hypothetical protein
MFPRLPIEEFSDAQLEKLRQHWLRIADIDPDSSSYKNLLKFLDGLPQPALKQLSKANIPYISSLAGYRIKSGSSLLSEVTKQVLWPGWFGSK